MSKDTVRDDVDIFNAHSVDDAIDVGTLGLDSSPGDSLGDPRLQHGGVNTVLSGQLGSQFLDHFLGRVLGL